jgi:hypothetical protein
MQVCLQTGMDIMIKLICGHMHCSQNIWKSGQSNENSGVIWCLIDCMTSLKGMSSRHFNHTFFLLLAKVALLRFFYCRARVFQIEWSNCSEKGLHSAFPRQFYLKDAGWARFVHKLMQVKTNNLYTTFQAILSPRCTIIIILLYQMTQRNEKSSI